MNFNYNFMELQKLVALLSFVNGKSLDTREKLMLEKIQIIKRFIKKKFISLIKKIGIEIRLIAFFFTIVKLTIIQKDKLSLK